MRRTRPLSAGLQCMRYLFDIPEHVTYLDALSAGPVPRDAAGPLRVPA